MVLALTQMYFHLLMGSIYFSFHVFLLCLLDVEKNSGYNVVEWHGIGYYLLAEPLVVCVHEKGENVFSPIAPSDNQHFVFLWEKSNSSKESEKDKQTEKKGSGLQRGLKMTSPSLSLTSPVFPPPLLCRVMNLALGQRGAKMWRPRCWNPIFLV